MMYLNSSNLRLRAPEKGDLDFLFRLENDTRLWMVSRTTSMWTGSCD